MPSGLDGNPDPIRTVERHTVLTTIATKLDHLAGDGITIVGIDGIDGAGKSTFADELAAELREAGRIVIRATIDSFHNPRAVRHRLGRSSPEGFYRDSHDLDSLRSRLLVPIAGGPGARFRRAAFDEPTDLPVDAPIETAGAGAILLFDGLFLHRPELRDFWNVSIFVDGDHGPAPRHDRYVSGQRLYFAECDPLALADIVVDNHDLGRPFITADRAV
jgi:uridine kinase